VPEGEGVVIGAAASAGICLQGVCRLSQPQYTSTSGIAAEAAVRRNIAFVTGTMVSAMPCLYVTISNHDDVTSVMNATTNTLCLASNKCTMAQCREDTFGRC
jgi:hypothetical protein